MLGYKISILPDCFGIDNKTRTVAIVGAGGKTSLMYFLAREIVNQGLTVVTTTTTKIFPPEPAQSPCSVTLAEDPRLASLHHFLTQFGHVTVGQNIIKSNGKLRGIDEDAIEICLRVAQCVLVEADGANGRPIKAPEEWEPVIPRQADLVIPIVGLDCLGKPVTDEWVFRMERFTAITGLQRGRIITPEAVAVLLSHPEGGLKNVKSRSSLVPFLNKSDVVADGERIEEIVSAILRSAGNRILRVVTGSLLLGDFTFRTFH